MLREEESPTVRVCVVGAGISGLRAAGLLASQGFEVTILEARDRIGGRIHQAHLSEAFVDLGASWIHGTNGNPLVQLAAATPSTTLPCGPVHSIFDVDGQYLDRSLSGDLYKKVWDVISAACHFSKTRYADIPVETTLKDYFTSQVEVLLAQEFEQDVANQKRLLLLIAEMWGAFMGADFETQSLKNLWVDEGVEGGVYPCSLPLHTRC